MNTDPTENTDPTDTAQQAAELPDDIQVLGYEQARDELFQIVRTLEAGQGSLEESIALWERGELLSQRCQQWLDGARDRLDAAIQRQQEQSASD